MASKALHEKARAEASAALVARGLSDETCVRQFLMAVALLETGYGYGWSGDGIGSNNMGAIQRGRLPCGDDAFGYGDTHEGGEVYAACFAVYPTRAAGWEALVSELYLRRRGVLAAARDCDMMSAVRQMRETGYFEAPLTRYQEGIRARITEIASALGEPNPVPKAGAGGSSAGGSPSPAVPRTISRGARGTEVRMWQRIAGTTVDGTFGLLTELATIRWQGRHELKPDGIVGPKTWWKALGL
jgi:hypothetical protein